MVFLFLSLHRNIQKNLLNIFLEGLIVDKGIEVGLVVSNRNKVISDSYENDLNINTRGGLTL